MTRRREKQRRPGQQKRKVSEMVTLFAWDFIQMGKTPEQRQSGLNAACSAWNMACNPSTLAKTLDQYMRKFEEFNASADEAELTGVRSNMETLVRKKLEMFPDDRRQIIEARLVPTGDGERIEVISLTMR